MLTSRSRIISIVIIKQRRCSIPVRESIPTTPGRILSTPKDSNLQTNASIQSPTRQIFPLLLPAAIHPRIRQRPRQTPFSRRLPRRKERADAREGVGNRDRLFWRGGEGEACWWGVI